MSKPLVVQIPHSLGSEEALRRLQHGRRADEIAVFRDKIASFDEQWASDRMSFKVGAMGQTVTGHLDVLDDHVRVEVQLPWILSVIADKAKSFIQKQGTLMLEKK